jgi:hypothetical protein
MSASRLTDAVNELVMAIIEHTQSAGAGVPSSSPAPVAHTTSNFGSCPVHHVEWRTTKGDGSPAKRAYCSQKDDDGSYCDERGPWLQSR